MLVAAVVLSACATSRPGDACAGSACGSDAAAIDKRVVEQIMTTLRNRPGIEFWEIQVQAHDDAVYLYGLVATTPERIDIEQIARDTSGGRKIVNSIEVRGERH